MFLVSLWFILVVAIQNPKSKIRRVANFASCNYCTDVLYYPQTYRIEALAMDVKTMIQSRLKSWFGNAMPAGACSGFLSSGVASLSSGVEATVSMRDRPLLKALVRARGCQQITLRDTSGSVCRE